VELHQRLLLSGIAALATASLMAAEPLAPGFGNLARLSAQGARVSAMVWDLDADRALAQIDPATRLVPASLSKIVIAAAALETWPPDKTFATQIHATVPIRAGVLNGDLILRGSGDATLDETTLWALAAQLRGAGLKQVQGKLIVERAPFGELDCDTVDRCRSQRRSTRAYNAAPSAIGVNYGSWCVTIRGRSPGENALVGGCATGDLPIPLAGRVASVAGSGTPRVDRDTGENGDRLTVGGAIASGEMRWIHRAMSDPAAGAGLILRSILMQTGVNISGGVETTLAVAGKTQVLAHIDGLQLQEQVGRMMRWSNNYIADVLTMNVALERSKEAPKSLAEAAALLGAMVQRAGAANAARALANGWVPTAATDRPLLESGSGLTTGNRLSAQDFIGVLQQQYRDTRRFPAFYGSFAVPRDAPFEYLRSGSPDWLDRVALKTGSLSEPVSVSGIAGYMRKKNGGWMAFAVIVNGSERLPQVARDRALGAARSDLEQLLGRY
jgi:D-alanyl-D-alanine carboxypeptidase/D-alanyl-D-alanine-endopeptidase (penicillin-binding protein 4)